MFGKTRCGYCDKRKHWWSRGQFFDTKWYCCKEHYRFTMIDYFEKLR